MAVHRDCEIVVSRVAPTRTAPIGAHKCIENLTQPATLQIEKRPDRPYVREARPFRISRSRSNSNGQPETDRSKSPQRAEVHGSNDRPRHSHREVQCA